MMFDKREYFVVGLFHLFSGVVAHSSGISLFAESGPFPRIGAVDLCRSSYGFKAEENISARPFDTDKRVSKMLTQMFISL